MSTRSVGHDDYARWTHRHIATFGLVGEKLGDTFAAWESIFLSLRYTADELREATDVLARTPPRFLSEHLGGIHDVIRARRDRFARTGGECMAGDDVGECVDCGNTGMVIVPHPKSIRHGVWMDRYTAAVYCRCSAGRSRGEAYDRLPAEVRERTRGRIFTLDEYQSQVCPDWRDLVAAREELSGEAQVRWRQALVGKDRAAVERFGDYLDRLWRKHVGSGR